MTKGPNSRPRAVCFTLNNYSINELKRLRAAGDSLKYLVFQLERGGTGTKHIQGYACAHSPKSFSGWKELVGTRAHIEAARGSAEENKAYCTKEDSRDSELEDGVRYLYMNINDLCIDPHQKLWVGRLD